MSQVSVIRRLFSTMVNTTQSPVRKTLHTHGITLSFLCWDGPTITEQGESGDSQPAPEPPSPVLLLHGLADHAGVWQALATGLSANHPVIAPDLRGHGESSKADGGYDCDQILADLTALMDHLDLSSVHVVAHSWSAKLACIWAARSPEKLKRLVLVDPAFTGKFPEWTRFSFPFFYRVLPFLKMMGPFQRYEEAETQAKELKQYTGWSVLQSRVFQDSIEQKTDGTWGSKFCIAARDGVFEDFTQVAGLTAPISVPTLFIRPTQGLNRSALQLRPYRQYIPQLTLEAVEGNHWAFLVDPESVNPKIAQFLR